MEQYFHETPSGKNKCSSPCPLESPLNNETYSTLCFPNPAEYIDPDSSKSSLPALKCHSPSYHHPQGHPRNWLLHPPPRSSKNLIIVLSSSDTLSTHIQPMDRLYPFILQGSPPDPLLSISTLLAPLQSILRAARVFKMQIRSP